MSSLKDRIIEAREAVGLDKAALVRALRPLRVTHSALSQLESGKSKSMKAETALAIARVTGFRVEYLVFGALPKRVGDTARNLRRAVEQGTSYQGPTPPSDSGMNDSDLLAFVIQQAESLPLFSKLSPAQRGALIAKVYTAVAKNDRKPSAAHVLRLLRSA